MTTSFVNSSRFGCRASTERSHSQLIPLTPRERQILKLIEAGQCSKQIADALAISTNTVNNHRASILAKLGVHSAIEALRIHRHLE
jgi:DNA-binding NarL/FixJ family response regulator